MQFAEEGAAKVFKPAIGSGFIVGVVGQLQFEVLASRIELEYGIPVRFEQSQFTSARWASGDAQAVDKFVNSNKQHIARAASCPHEQSTQMGHRLHHQGQLARHRHFRRPPSGAGGASDHHIPR